MPSLGIAPHPDLADCSARRRGVSAVTGGAVVISGHGRECAGDAGPGVDRGAGRCGAARRGGRGGRGVRGAGAALGRQAARARRHLSDVGVVPVPGRRLRGGRDQGHRVAGPVRRLGREVFPELFERTCGPVAGDTSPSAGLLALGTARGAFLRGWRLLAIDGFELDAPDTPANAAEFGYAGCGENRSAFCKARVVALAECGTHAFLAAEVAGYAVGEKTLAQRLYSRLRTDELLTADRGFYSYKAWDTAAATGAALLWRAPTQLRLPVVRVLEDGTWLTVVMDPAIRGARREAILAAARAGNDLAELPDAVGEHGWPAARLARVVEYDVPDREGNGTGEVITLITTITDPADARADELAVAYHERWEEETANDQLKTHLRGPGKVLRSRLPDLVYQEIWAYLIVHHAISALIAKASAAADLDPDRISFAKALRLIRRTATGTADIPPSGLG